MSNSLLKIEDVKLQTQKMKPVVEYDRRMYRIDKVHQHKVQYRVSYSIL